MSDAGGASDVSLNALVGRNVRAIRTEQGLTQEGLAAALGWSRDAVSATECGTNNLSLRSVDQLAERLGVTTGRLLRDPERRPGVGRGRRPARR